MSYQRDRSWSDLMIGEIRAIVGPHLLQPTSFKMDTEQAADLFVFTAKDMTIAARVRRPGYADRYPFEFTIRSARDSGATTELSKIIDRWGDWFFYGHASETDHIGRWWLIDLHAFRAALIRHNRIDGVCLLSLKKDNGDGTHFIAYDLRSFPAHPSILVAGSHVLPAAHRRVA